MNKEQLQRLNDIYFMFNIVDYKNKGLALDEGYKVFITGTSRRYRIRDIDFILTMHEFNLFIMEISKEEKENE